MCALRAPSVFYLVSAWLTSSCTVVAPQDTGDVHGHSGLADAATLAPSAPAALRVLTWNLNWLGDTGPMRGPADDQAQAARVVRVLEQLDADVVALQELAAQSALRALLTSLPAYAGVASTYTQTQKTALLWKIDELELVRADSLWDLEDAGRPPLVVVLRRKREARELTAVVIHAKAGRDESSHLQRQRLAAGLHRALAALSPGMPVVVLGDFNDRLHGSITKGTESPYRIFVDDPAYMTPTARIDAADGSSSSYAFGPSVDHIMLRSDASEAAQLVSAEVLRDELLEEHPSHVDTVSDHFPVTALLHW